MLKQPAADGVNAEHGKEIFRDGHGECALVVARAGHQAQPADQRSLSFVMLHGDAAWSPHIRKLRQAGGDDACEGAEVVAIGEVVGIAENGIGDPGMQDHRQVGHGCGVAGIERPRKEGFVRGKGRGADANPERESQDGREGEAPMPAQNAGSEVEILPEGLRQEQEIDFAHAFAPQGRIAKAKACLAACFVWRKTCLAVALLAHREVEVELFVEFAGMCLEAEEGTHFASPAHGASFSQRRRHRPGPGPRRR